jgi:hypothetical protein
MAARPPSPGAAPSIWGNVPRRNKNFTGRTEILDHLRRGVPGRVAAILPAAAQGIGGVGKTAVAIEYAHRFRSDYDLIWWVPADDPVLVPSSLAALAEPLGLQSAMAAGVEGAATAVLDALRRGVPYPRWLLIFDNADQPEEINEIIPRGPGDILITAKPTSWPRNSAISRWPWNRRAHCRPKPACTLTNTCVCCANISPSSFPREDRRSIHGP